MKQPYQKTKRDFICVLMLAFLLIGAFHFVGCAVRMSPLAVESVRENAASQLANSLPTDSVITQLERQIQTQNKTPRRQTSFGLLPSSSDPQLLDIVGERSLDEEPYDPLTIASHQHDRAPPHVIA